LDKTLLELLAAPNARAWDEVHGASRLSREVARRLCQNTLEPKNRAWGPVMATTLLGGVVVTTHDATRVHLITIGDGVVELGGALAGAPPEQLLTTDPNETAISESLSPGPLGRRTVAQLTANAAFTLPRTATLVVSSDGLARGHTSPVYTKLEELAVEDGFPALSEERGATLRVLARCASFADAEHERDAANLFNDNLSLVLIRSKENPDGKS
jgi:hypothetical protein